MQDLAFGQSDIHHIDTPFAVTEEQFTPTDSITETLGVLVPDKKDFFENRRARRQSREGPGIILVTSPSREPLGAPAGVLEEYLFTDLPEALSDVSGKYAIHSILFEERSFPGAPRAIGNRESFLIVTLYELFLLWKSVKENRKSHGVLCSIFLDPEHSFVAHVDSGTPMKRVFSSLPGIDEHRASRAGSLPYDPLTGGIYDPDSDLITGRSRVIMFTESGYVLAPRGTGIFSFPYRGKTIHVTGGSPEPAEEKPCNNCLACVRFCPAGIHPAYIYHNLIQENLDEAIKLSMGACIRCGICSFVCPAYIPLASALMEALDREMEE